MDPPEGLTAEDAQQIAASLPDLACRKELARTLGVCVNTLRLWEREGRLPTVRLSDGGRVLYTRSAVTRFLTGEE